jgi:hypothetical protein
MLLLLARLASCRRRRGSSSSDDDDRAFAAHTHTHTHTHTHHAPMPTRVLLLPRTRQAAPRAASWWRQRSCLHASSRSSHASWCRCARVRVCTCACVRGLWLVSCVSCLRPRGALALRCGRSEACLSGCGRRLRLLPSADTPLPLSAPLSRHTSHALAEHEGGAGPLDRRARARHRHR